MKKVVERKAERPMECAAERPMLIGEVARRSGLTRDTVRFYERQNLIKSGERTAGSRVYNEYAPAVIERLAFIRQSQSAGFTLREIKDVLDEWGVDINAIPREELIAVLEAKFAQVEEKLRHLQEVRAYLAAKLERLHAETDCVTSASGCKIK